MNRILFVSYNIMGKRGITTSFNLRAGNISDSLRLKRYMRPGKTEILKIKLYTWGEIKLTKNIKEYNYKISTPIVFRKIVLNSYIRC